MSPETDQELKNESQEEETKQGGNKTFLWFGIFVAVSFALVFASTFFLVNKLSPPQPAPTETVNADSTLVETDSLSTVASTPDSAAIDSTALAMGLDMEKFRQLKMIDRMSMLQSQLAAKETQIASLQSQLHEKKKLTVEEELTLLRQENEKKQATIDKFQEKLLDVVSKTLQKSQAQAQPAVTANATMTSPDNRTASTSQASSAEASVGLRKLAKIYEAMKAQEAAPILSKMKEEEIVDILLRMRQRQSAKIMAEFEPGLAAKISKRISER